MTADAAINAAPAAMAVTTTGRSRGNSSPATSRPNTVNSIGMRWPISTITQTPPSSTA